MFILYKNVERGVARSVVHATEVVCKLKMCNMLERALQWAMFKNEQKGTLISAFQCLPQHFNHPHKIVKTQKRSPSSSSSSSTFYVFCVLLDTHTWQFITMCKCKCNAIPVSTTNRLFVQMSVLPKIALFILISSTSKFIRIFSQPRVRHNSRASSLHLCHIELFRFQRERGREGEILEK